MKHLLFCLLGLAVASPSFADGNSLAEARQRWLHGNYEEARAAYEEAGKDDKSRDAAALGLSRAWQSSGEYDKALAVIDSAVKDHADNADLLARRAELLYLRGRWDEAEKAADAALEAQKENFLAHWVRGQVYRDRGDLKKADGEFRWFVRTYTARNDNDNPIKDPDALLLVGLAACDYARWHGLADQFQFVLTDVYGDILKESKDYWPAEYQAGMLLLEKYNRGEAMDAFDKALAINPQAAEALVGKGTIALQKFEIKDAERLAERALKINPNLPEALCLRADVYQATGDVAAAQAALGRALKVNPRDERTLGRVAACLYLQHNDAGLQALVKEVEAHDQKPGLFYFHLAEQLDDRRRYDEAEKYYKKSAELWPMLPWAPNALGLLYMRMGREDEARKILEKAFEADGFNVRVSNTLKVLHHLEKYQTIKTEHFELRFDPKHDQLLANYMARYLEDTYADLAKKFRYRPEGLILVEVFNNHDMFSGRTVALPDLHTIGACTGRMFAMVSPRGKGINRPFNWARVVRHELVHIFNLEQTRFQVPHWYTEGLAVNNEGFPRPQQWNELLRERVPAGELMDLGNIDLGFIRPRTPLDWHMAYCQSQLYVQYMIEKFGPQTVGEMLDAYRDGLDSAAAIAQVCKVSKAEFEKGYRVYLDGVTKTLHGKPAAKAMTLAQLQDAAEKNPDDADLAARLAEQYLVRQRNAEARKSAEAALAKKPNHPLASVVKAKLLLASGDEEAARKLLEAAVDDKAPDTKVLQALGKLYFESKDFLRAEKILELGRKAEPYESKWLVELARVYAQTGEKEKQIEVLKALVPTDADDLEQRKRLARLLLEADKPAEAEAYARQALEIDVLDADAQQALGDALLDQKKYGEAIEAFRAALQVNDMADDVRLKLAQAYLENGQKEKAQNEIAKVLAHDAENAQAKRLLKLLEN